MYVLTFIHCVSVYGTQCKCCRTCKQGLLKSPQKKVWFELCSNFLSIPSTDWGTDKKKQKKRRQMRDSEKHGWLWPLLHKQAEVIVLVCVCCVHVMAWQAEGACSIQSCPHHLALAKWTVFLQSLSLPCLFAWGFDTHPSREITHFHIPVLFPGLFCFLKMVFVCQHIYGMGGWVCSQAEREREKGLGGMK